VGRAWVHAPFFLPEFQQTNEGEFMKSSNDPKVSDQMVETKEAFPKPMKWYASYLAFASSGLLLGALIPANYIPADLLFRVGLGTAAFILIAIGVVFSRDMTGKLARLSEHEGQEEFPLSLKPTEESNFYKIYRDDSTSTSMKRGIPSLFYQLELKPKGG
jgi:hypothetical protein